MTPPPNKTFAGGSAIIKNDAAALSMPQGTKRTFGRTHLTSGIMKHPPWRGSFHFAEIRLIGELDAVLERGAGAPAQFGQPADVEQFARRAGGFWGVKAAPAAISDGGCDDAREFGDGDVLA